MTLRAHRSPVPTAAFSLVEVAVALGIAAFGLISIFSLLPTGINSSQDAVRATIAADLATAIVSDMQSARLNGSSTIYGLTPDAAQTESIYLRDDGRIATEGAAKADYRAGVVVSPSTNTKISQVRVRIGWPAQSTNPGNSFEVVTALDRASAR